MSFWSRFTLANITRKQKVILPSSQGADALPRVLRWWDLMTFGIASTVGAGIFVTSGVAMKIAGGGIIFAFVLAGFAALLSGLCYAEYAARIPVSGSSYTFIYVTLGELAGWLVGWNMTLEYAVSASAVAQGWAGYFVQMMDAVGVKLPWYLREIHLWGPFSISALGLIIVVFCTAILLFGVEESSMLNMIMTVINILVIVFIIALGATHFDYRNWQNFFANAEGNSPMAGTMAAAAAVFFSFIGFDSVTTLAGEVRNPKRDLPLAIVLTLAIVTSLYVGVSVVLTGMVNFVNVDIHAPLSTAFTTLGIRWAAIIVAIASVTTLTTTTLTSLIGQPRVFYQMAKDGLLFPSFASVNRRGVPLVGTLVSGILAGILAFFFNIKALSEMISAGTLIAYGTVAAGIIILRYSPEEPVRGESTALVRTAGSHSRYPRSDRLEKFAYAVSRYKMLILFFFVIACIMLGVSLRNNWPIEVSGSIGGLMLAITITFAFLRETNLPSTFKTPFVPLVPLASIAVNILLITRLPVDAIYRVAIWTLVGAVIYALYGLHHSRLNFEKLEYKPKILDPEDIHSHDHDDSHFDRSEKAESDSEAFS